MSPRGTFRRDLALVWRELPRGKSLARMLTNLDLAGEAVEGHVLDVGGVGRESHYRFLDVREGTRIRNVNLDRASRPDVVVDFDGSGLPFAGDSVDRVHCFNVCEHVYDLRGLLREFHRILGPEGRLLGSVPFLVNVHPDPRDFARYTADFWERILDEEGFREVSIRAIGRGPYTAACSLVEGTVPRLARPVVATLALSIDRVLERLRPDHAFGDRFPMAYVFSARK